MHINDNLPSQRHTAPFPQHITHNNTQPTKHNTQCITYNPHSLSLTLTHSLTHSPTHTHTQSLTHSLTPSPPSLTHPLTHFNSTSLHFTSLHFTHSLTYIIIIMCQRCLPATGHAERVHKMCGCARKSAEHYFGQRKYGEHTIVLIVCRKKNIRAWWNSMKAKQLTHKQLTLRTYIHRYLNTYIPIYLPTYLHTYHHRPSITLILPLPFSLSVLRLSLKKLLTCGVIRSYNFLCGAFWPARGSLVSRQDCMSWTLQHIVQPEFKVQARV